MGVAKLILEDGSFLLEADLEPLVESKASLLLFVLVILPCLFLFIENDDDRRRHVEGNGGVRNSGLKKLSLVLAIQGDCALQATKNLALRLNLILASP